MNIYNPPLNLFGLDIKRGRKYRLKWTKHCRYGLPYEVMEVQRRHYNPHAWGSWKISWITIHAIRCDNMPIEGIYSNLLRGQMK